MEILTLTSSLVRLNISWITRFLLGVQGEAKSLLLFYLLSSLFCETPCNQELIVQEDQMELMEPEIKTKSQEKNVCIGNH